MKKNFHYFLFTLVFILIFKNANASTSELSQAIDSLMDPLVKFLEGIIFWDPLKAVGIDIGADLPIVVIWLVFGASYFTLKFRFINFRGMRHAVDLIRGRYDKPGDEGEVSHFQALTTALSATVGLGNIAGVAIAVSIGGPGATFWMILAGLLGMASKFTECTLGVKYRRIDPHGEVSGGPMFYLSRLWKGSQFNAAGKVLAAVFAVLCIGGSFGGGNMFQANQAFAQLSGQIPSLEGKGVYFGIILAIFVGLVIIGGIKSIARVTEKIVPFMAAFYVITALIIIVMNITETGKVIHLILAGAFSPAAAKGGIVGVLVQGFRRAAFSNEAGVGSASIAHSVARTDEPVSEGIVALLEPFIDTVVICTMTAMVIIFTGRYEGFDLDGSQLTSNAFGSVFSWFPFLLVIAIFLFAFSTMISWSYYGLKSWVYLFGSSKTIDITYKTLFLVFTVIGSAISLNNVVAFSDMMILAMAFPNIIGLLSYTPEVKRDLDNYLHKVKSGEIKRVK